MYYVDREQIDSRLSLLPELCEAAGLLVRSWDPGDRLQSYALERIIHIALETVTDVGSLLIDGFMMRDASSYEDIITILHGERVFDETVEEPLLRLVRQRRPLVQEYAAIRPEDLLQLAGELPTLLETFTASVQTFIAREML